MLLGQTLRAVTGNGTLTSVYWSPWMPRLGTKAVFGCNHIASAGLDSFKIVVETKRSEDDNRADSIEEVGASAATITLTADSVTTFERGNKLDGSDGSTDYGFRDLIRFKYIVKSSVDVRGWVHFRMLDPSWETD